MNKTILEKVRHMLLSSDMPNIFWGEVVKTTNYLINRSPASIIHFKTLEKMWIGKPVGLVT